MGCFGVASSDAASSPDPSSVSEPIQGRNLRSGERPAVNTDSSCDLPQE